MDNILKKLHAASPVYYFLAPVIITFFAMGMVNLGCQKKTAPPGPVRLLFTGDVGGRLDPCG
jgi:hypothetical protein